jgi:signal transduction histidine kinase/CheY-like chemotaxis protein
MNDLAEEDYDSIEVAPAKLLERYLAEIDILDRAIIAARIDGSLTAEAIANEGMAKLYEEWGKEKVAAVYLQTAYDCYTQAGASLKTDDLAHRYPQLFQSIRPQRHQIGGDHYFTDEFIATLSHEFRTPLNGILGMSEALLEEVFGCMNERQLNAVTTIERSGAYLLALINNMADLSKIQVGKLELEIAPMSVAELCQSSITFVKHHAIQKQIQLDWDVPTDAGYISVDFQRLRQVLINLLSHAIDSTPIGGKVKLAVTKQPADSSVNPSAAIQFSVIDTSKELAPSSVDKFSELSATVTNQRIGFGLMLVNPIVELHGGKLSFQSTIRQDSGSANGRGSCVNVVLPDTCSISAAETIDNPIEMPHQCDATIEDIADADTIGREILEPPLIPIGEDNELNINTISSYLTAKGYRPIVAADGKSGIELTQKYRPDLILMDIQMPGMDGLAAISHIRTQPELAQIPIIALTALAMEGDRDKCLAAGANDYLTKPVKLKQLNNTIQQFLVAKIDNTYAAKDLWL